MSIEVIEIVGPATFASALINGDYSGLDQAETDLLNQFLISEVPKDARIVDVWRDEDGQGADLRFGRWWNGTYGDLITYIALKGAHDGR